MASMASEAAVEVKIGLAPSTRELPATLLMPILRNGLRNAIEAASCGETARRVEVASGIDGRGRLTILITDTGPGLPEEPEDESLKPAGSGLGLWLSQRLVAELGGELSILNIPFGSGAAWRLVVPTARLGRSS